jgi:hypothetical protein
MHMASVAATSAAVAKLDVRPIRPVGSDTVPDQAVALRDRFAAAMMAVLDQEKVRATLLKSEPGNYPAWVRLEAWIPAWPGSPSRHERCELELIVETRPFNRQVLACGARLARGKRTIAVAERSRFSEHDVEEWTRHAIGRGPVPSSYRPIRHALAERLSLLIPPLSRRYNPIDRRFRAPRLDVRTLAAVAASGLLAVALAYQPLLDPVALALGGLTVILALLVPMLGRINRYHDWVVAQPREGPRHLRHVDSWHAVLISLGGEVDHLKACLLDKLAETPGHMLDIRSEHYGYRTPNGYEERERIVVSHRQGYVHIHIHALGDNLFVGWQALLNWAQWAETTPFATVEVGRRSIAFRDVKPAWYYPSEFDLIDLNSLSAVVHGAIEREIKLLAAEHAVTQEIDFEVIRADRGNALDQRKAWPERPQKHERISNVIFGWGAVRRASAGQMQLAPVDSKPPGRDRRGLAAIPPVILLPLIAGLGYLWVYQTGRLDLFAIQQSEDAVFTPMLDLPLAIALAVGLRLYAGVGLLNALLAMTLVLVADFSTSFAYFFLLPSIGPNLADVSPVLPDAVPTALSALCYLLAASIWVAGMRRPARWFAGVVLWTVLEVAAVARASTASDFDIAQLSLQVFIAASFGFWLWRDDMARSRTVAARAWPWRRAAAAQPRQPAAAMQVPGVPAAIVLAAIAALGYAVLYQVEQQGLLSRELVGPALHLPLAVALAIGLWRYAGVGIVSALIFIALVEALTVGAVTGYFRLAFSILDPQEFRTPAVALWYSTGASALTSVCYLLAISIWVPGLRSAVRWLVALALWTAWTFAASMAIQEFHLVGPQATALNWSVRVLMAATFGYWLSRSSTRAAPAPLAAGRRIIDFGARDVLSLTWAVLWRNPLKFMLVTVIASLPATLMTVPNGGTPDSAAAVNEQQLALAVGSAVLATILAMLSQAVVLGGVLDAIRGRPVALVRSARIGLHRFFSLVGLAIVVSGLVGVGLALFIVPGIALYTIWFVATPVCVVERFGVFASMRRSTELTAGYRWKIFAMYLPILAAAVVIAGVLGAIEAGVFPALESDLALPLARTANLIWSAVWTAFYSIAVVVTYHDLRAVKERVSTTQIAAALEEATPVKSGALSTFALAWVLLLAAALFIPALLGGAGGGMGSLSVWHWLVVVAIVALVLRRVVSSRPG